MDDLMNKIQSVLSDEESMKQIKELAQMLSGESSAENKDNSSEKENNVNNTADLSKLVSALAPQNTKPATRNSTDFDVEKLIKIGTVLQSAGKSDKNIDFLLSLKPLLKKENQIKIDRLVKIFRLFSVYPILKENGLLGDDLFGIFG